MWAANYIETSKVPTHCLVLGFLLIIMTINLYWLHYFPLVRCVVEYRYPRQYRNLIWRLGMLVLALVLSKCKRMKTSGKELTQDNTFWVGNFHSKTSVSIKVDIAITKSVIIDFRVFDPSKSCFPAFNSLNEWKFTLLHLESIPILFGTNWHLYATYF